MREFPDVVMLSSRRVSSSHAERLARAVGCALARREITGGARVRLKMGNCDRGPMVVQVNLRVRGAPARVMAVTAGTGDLTPVLARLDRQIEALSAPWRARPWPDLTRRILTAGPDAVVARRKAVSLQRVDPYGGSGGHGCDGLRRAPVHRRRDRGGRRGLPGRAGRAATGAAALGVPSRLVILVDTLRSAGAALVVNPRRAPALTEAVAVHLMREHRSRLLFFTDPATGRGRLLYPRYDGALGLIAPVDRG